MPKAATRASAKSAVKSAKTAPKPAPKASPSQDDIEAERPDSAPKQPLPPSLIQALPVSKMIVRHLAAMTGEIAQLERELNAAKLMGAVPLARAFVVFHRVMEKLDHDLKPLSKLFEQCKYQTIPETFEQEGVPSVALAEGYRVGTAIQTRASIRKGMKDEAYQWLRENGLGDLITATVNASTLSSAARTMLEDDNIEMPDRLFNVARMTTTSVTKT